MRQCALCGKSHKMGGTRKLLRGHYNPTNWKKKKANLQYTRLPDTGKSGKTTSPGRRVLACTRCLRTLLKKK